MTSSDPRRYTDETGKHRVKTLKELSPPYGYTFSTNWSEGEWKYGVGSFAQLIKDLSKGKSCELHANSSVRRKLWSRNLIPISKAILDGFNVDPSISDFSEVANDGQNSEDESFVTDEPNESNDLKSEQAIHISFDNVIRCVLISPDTLAIEVNIKSDDGSNDRLATLVVGPCMAEKLGSLLVERVSMLTTRSAIQNMVLKLRTPASPASLLSLNPETITQKRLSCISED